MMDVSHENAAAARALAERWGIPHEVVIGYLVSEGRLPVSAEAVHEWGTRTTTFPLRREDGGPWRPFLSRRGGT